MPLVVLVCPLMDIMCKNKIPKWFKPAFFFFLERFKKKTKKKQSFSAHCNHTAEDTQFRQCRDNSLELQV